MEGCGCARRSGGLRGAWGDEAVARGDAGLGSVPLRAVGWGGRLGGWDGCGLRGSWSLWVLRGDFPC